MQSSALNRLVITGAPCSGKSEAVALLATLPRFREHTIFPELARQLLTEQPDFRSDWHRFHLEIYRRQVARESAIEGRPFLTDRGTVDAFAFHPETVSLVASSIEREYTRYSAVLQLGTAAQLGPEWYQSDAIRSETAEDALQIEAALTKVWHRHPTYRFIRATVDFSQKLEQVVATIMALDSSEEQVSK